VVRAGTYYYRRAGYTKGLMLHISEATYEKLRRRAFREERSLQKTVRLIIEKALK
jgi:hypothetical protein